MNVYVLSEPAAPWGDYGSILIHGMSMHLGRQDGLIQLERTGPFMPPVTKPGLEIVVTDAFRKQLEASGLTGFAFRPVIKRHIVRLSWEQWDRDAAEPPEYPEGGEPEGYILDRPHDPEAAEEMGAVWELVVETGARVERVGDWWDLVISVVTESLTGADLFRAEGVGYTYVSERARNWFVGAAGEWVDFKAARMV